MAMASADHYKIGQIVRAFGVTPRAVRYYEACGLVNPSRSGSDRVFSRFEYERLRFIIEARRAGLGVIDIQELLDLHDPRDGGRRQLERKVQLLEDHLQKVEAQRQALRVEIDRSQSALKALDRPTSRAA
ncbi:MAG TPA: MerR family transcriptional regulator [Caulobacteraceae bacterium]